jgi:iron complex transport system substrate-binding protein
MKIIALALLLSGAFPAPIRHLGLDPGSIAPRAQSPAPLAQRWMPDPVGHDDAGAGTRPKRIVSLNLCADQFLLTLADRGDIAALTRFARDSGMSAASDAAKGVPVTRGGAEEVLALRPDLLFVAPGFGAARAVRLAARGVKVVELPPAESYAAIREQALTVATAIGRPERGRALIATMDRDLAAVPRPGGGKVAAYYQRRGFLTGTGTLVDELMARVGLANLATRLGTGPLARVSLERMALARPDFLIVEDETARVEDRGSELLHHPLLSGTPRLTVPQSWTVCGGPAYVEAARSLARQLAQKRTRAPA